MKTDQSAFLNHILDAKKKIEKYLHPYCVALVTCPSSQLCQPRHLFSLKSYILEVKILTFG